MHLLVAFDHLLLLFKALKEVEERLFHGVQVCSKLLFLSEDLVDLSIGKLLLSLGILLRRASARVGGSPQSGAWGGTGQGGVDSGR